MKIGRALLPIIAGVLVAATGCADWPYPQFNAGSTADNATETTITSANVSTLTQKWVYRPAVGWKPSSTPLDAGGKVFISEEGYEQGQYVSRLVALDEQTGKVHWSRLLPRKSRPLGVVNGLLVVNLDRMYRDVAGQPPNTSLAAFSVQDGTLIILMISTLLKEASIAIP